MEVIANAAVGIIEHVRSPLHPDTIIHFFAALCLIPMFYNFFFWLCQIIWPIDNRQSHSPVPM